MAKLVTPLCGSKYLWIFEPNKKFSADGVYSVTCVIEPTQAWAKLIKEMEQELEEYYDTSCKAAKRKLKRCPYKPWKDVLDAESGKVTERVLECKNNAVGKKKDGTTFVTTPRVVGPDPDIDLLASDLKGKLGNGTRVRVGFESNTWTNDAQGVGISCRLKMVQVVTPSYYSATTGFVDPSGETTGFEKVETDWFRPRHKVKGHCPEQDIQADGEFLADLASQGG